MSQASVNERYFEATNMISTSPSAFTRPVRTVAREGRSFVSTER